MLRRLMTLALLAAIVAGPAIARAPSAAAARRTTVLASFFGTNVMARRRICSGEGPRGFCTGIIGCRSAR